VPKQLPPRVLARQARVDALIATPRGTTVKELSATVKAIKKVYFALRGADEADAIHRPEGRGCGVARIAAGAPAETRALITSSMLQA